ncbi:uncharacterized protein LOC117316440 [Pecten maximus]|uniref:uncharacterized protein LOC117316440 n=1 Tax=Pecten maximus TaxID=6579 RepID=UPI0014586AA2|nr:uncharacterized protein LOC117316440 [Pecten maximus]
MSRNLFYCRIGAGLGITCVTVTCLLTIDIVIAVEHPRLLIDSDRACSMKAAFSLFVMSTIAQFMMGIIDIVLLCKPKNEEATSNTECKHFKIIIHFCSGAGIFIASLIYGIKYPGRVRWSFWMALVAGFFAIANAVLWLLTQQTKRYLEKAGVNVKNLEDGKMADGTERE